MRIAFLGDIHGNLAALEAVLSDIDCRKVDEITHTGDIVGYCSQFAEVIECLERREIGGVIGNHEQMLLGSLDTARASESARDAVNWSRARLDARSEMYVRALPEHVIESEYIMFHATPGSIVKSVKRAGDACKVFADMKDWPYCRLAVHGHTHIQRIFVDSGTCAEAVAIPDNNVVSLHSGRRYLVCPGSVGVSRDRDRRAGYMIFDTSGTLEFYRINYDWRQTRKSNRRAELSTELFVSRAGKIKRLLSRMSFGRIAIRW